MKKRYAMMLAVLLALTAGIAFAQDYPTKPINLIIPFAPGGASDVVARIISPLMSKELGQQIVVDNRAGASGNIGVAYAARASNDGYNVLLGNIGTMAINPALFKKFPVKPVRDFVAVTQVVDAPTALVLHPSIPAKTVKEFIAYAKERPGKLNFGTAGPGSNGRLEMELFMDYTGINLVQVPYKGGAGAAAIGLLSGEVQCGFQTLASVMTHVNAGKLRVVGVAAQKRVKALPDVPIMPELGFESMRSGSWQGVFVPAGTPAPIVSKLFAVMTKVMADPEVIKRLNASGIEVVTSKSQEEFAAFMKSENEKV
ncbi:MAG: tripartite tricarboxylate transporter substrate binding protein, partial [Deltaproteobacteria bacterium]|nr:tripartite tricarboxylate transporter substrate binding protein [Deltaproteobacteria bacterium]